MVVTLGACDCQTEPNGAGGVDAVDDVRGLILLGNDASLKRNHVIAVEAAGDALIEGRVGQQIARDLFDGELVEG